MSSKKKWSNDIVEDGRWETKVQRRRGEDDYEEEDLSSFDRCDCGNWDYLNEDGLCNDCLRNSQCYVQ